MCLFVSIHVILLHDTTMGREKIKLFDCEVFLWMRLSRCERLPLKHRYIGKHRDLHSLRVAHKHIALFSGLLDCHLVYLVWSLQCLSLHSSGSE